MISSQHMREVENVYSLVLVGNQQGGSMTPRKGFHRLHTRLFYMAKGTLCLLLAYRRSPKKQFFCEWINLTCFDFYKAGGEYGGEGWEAVEVGYGVFRNWFVRSYTDTSC